MYETTRVLRRKLVIEVIEVEREARGDHMQDISVKDIPSFSIPSVETACKSQDCFLTTADTLFKPRSL